MPDCNVHLLPDDIHLTVGYGTLISDAIRSAGIYLTLPCGGRGACGCCMVNVADRQVKACVTPIEEDLEIEIPDSLRLAGQKVLMDIRLYDSAQNVLPRVERLFLEMDAPTPDDSVCDATRLKQALAAKTGIALLNIFIEASCLPELPHRLRSNGFAITVNFIHENNGITILSLDDGPLCGIAVDIGTTTVALALCDLTTGVVMGTVGIPNPQAEYGSDVISRIVYTEENHGGTEKLRGLIIKSLSDSITLLSRQVKIDPSKIPFITIAANTVMSHFLLGLPTDYLRREPYVPAATEYPLLRPSEMGLPILPCGRVLVIPGISSYVGGDITAGVIASNLHATDGLGMLIDIGTNGEIVLTGEGFMVACSSSAGPAFEGSGISCGSRAIQGAVDNVYLDGEQILFDVIGGDGVEPSSLCGSGLISLISVLLQKKIIDRSGHFTTTEKFFRLAPKVSIVEDDIMNLIRAKGAIFAGMRVLANFMDTGLHDIKQISIAGGFGRSMNINNAVSIGMLPQLDDKTYSYVGNSSLAGALRILCDRTIDPVGVAASILNLELSVGNDFMNEFTKACFLPHTDLSLFQ